MRADARKNYDLLIDVAREVFVEQGAEASLRDIARRAGSEWEPSTATFPTATACWKPCSAAALRR
nr:hypothetical protein KV8917_420006 [Klebsiella variicola]